MLHDLNNLAKFSGKVILGIALIALLIFSGCELYLKGYIWWGITQLAFGHVVLVYLVNRAYQGNDKNGGDE